MFTFLLTVMILDGILLMVLILLQAGQGDGLAAMGGGGTGTDSFIGGRQAATLLTKGSWIGGGVFLALALVLSVMSSQQQQPSSVLEGQFQQAAPAAPQPVLPGVEPAEPAAQPVVPGTQPEPGTAGSNEPPVEPTQPQR